MFDEESRERLIEIFEDKGFTFDFEDEPIVDVKFNVQHIVFKAEKCGVSFNLLVSLRTFNSLNKICTVAYSITARELMELNMDDEKKETILRIANDLNEDYFGNKGFCFYLKEDKEDNVTSLEVHGKTTLPYPLITEDWTEVFGEDAYDLFHGIDAITEYFGD